MGDRVSFQFVPVPSAANRRPSTETKQPIFFARISYKRCEVRAVLIRTEPNQVSSATLRAFYAVTQAVGHKTHRSRNASSSNGGQECHRVSSTTSRRPRTCQSSACRLVARRQVRAFALAKSIRASPIHITAECQLTKHVVFHVHSNYVKRQSTHFRFRARVSD